MMGFLRRRGPTAIAVTLAFLAGGGAAVTAQNLITSADIKDGTIKTADLANGAVNSNKIANQSVANADFANNAVGSAKISDGAVATADIANGAVNSNKITNQSVANADLANNAVGSAKISDGAVGTVDLANNAVNSAKIADATVKTADLANNAVNSAKIADGTIQADDISPGAQESLTAISGPDWSIVDRNVIGNGDSYLRAGPTNGPVAPPFGVGSLGVRTGSPDDAAAFGNQVDFFGMPVSDLTAVGFHVFTTQENNGRGPNNMPAISFEIDPNVTGISSNFSTMVYVPSNGLPLAWTPFNAVTDPDAHWGLTGAAFAGTPCDINGARCNWDDLMGYLDDGDPGARIHVAQITLGRNLAFSGAVDALRINDTIYDFEPNGVVATPAAP
jgi:hypothetical protein